MTVAVIVPEFVKLPEILSISMVLALASSVAVAVIVPEFSKSPDTASVWTVLA